MMQMQPPLRTFFLKSLLTMAEKLRSLFKSKNKKVFGFGVFSFRATAKNTKLVECMIASDNNVGSFRMQMKEVLE